MLRDCDPADLATLRRYLDLLRSARPLSADQVDELMVAKEAGCGEARRMLIEANLRLVVSVARRYCGNQVSLLDLIQEGNVGLMQAVDRFDRSYSTRFSTYAVFWIRKVVCEAVTQRGRLVRMPEQAFYDAGHLRRAQAELDCDRERSSPAILAERSGLSLERARRAETWHVPSVGIDALETLPGATAVSDTFVERVHLRTDLAARMGYLEPGDREVVRLRYGLDGGPERSQAEVARLIGRTRDQVRVAERRALSRLRPMVATGMRATGSA